VEFYASPNDSDKVVEAGCGRNKKIKEEDGVGRRAVREDEALSTCVM